MSGAEMTFGGGVGGNRSDDLPAPQSIEELYQLRFGPMVRLARLM
jgi:hypothetical protein